jgi:hypothetical protein
MTSNRLLIGPILATGFCFLFAAKLSALPWVLDPAAAPAKAAKTTPADRNFLNSKYLHAPAQLAARVQKLLQGNGRLERS